MILVLILLYYMGRKFNHKFINKSHIDWQEGQIFVIVRCLTCGFGKFLYKYRDQTIYVNSQGKRVPHAEPCESYRQQINEAAIQLVEKKLNLKPPKFLSIKDVSVYHKGKMVEGFVAPSKPKQEVKPDLMAPPKEEGPIEFKKHQEDMDYELEKKPNAVKPRISFKDLKAKPAPDNPKQLDTPTTDTNIHIKPELEGNDWYQANKHLLKDKDTKPDIIHGVPGVDFKYSEPIDDLRDVLPPREELTEMLKIPNRFMGIDPAKPGGDVSAGIVMEGDKIKYISERLPIMDFAKIADHYTKLPEFLKDHPKQPINLVARLEEAVVLIRIMYDEMLMIDNGPRTKGMKMAHRYLQSPEYKAMLKELETQRQINKP